MMVLTMKLSTKQVQHHRDSLRMEGRIGESIKMKVEIELKKEVLMLLLLNKE